MWRCYTLPTTRYYIIQINVKKYLGVCKHRSEIRDLCLMKLHSSETFKIYHIFGHAKIIQTFVWFTGNRRQLCLLPLIWNVSHLTIFPLELFGPAIGFSANPSSSKGKSWDEKQKQILPTTSKCPLLDLVWLIPKNKLLKISN